MSKTKKATKKAVRKGSAPRAKSQKSKKTIVNKPATKEFKMSKPDKAKDFESKANKLIQKGRDRGFVTYDEILKEFPQIENDIIFLD